MPAQVEAMEHHDLEEVVSQQLKRLWALLSNMDEAHLARLARIAGKRTHRPSHGRRAA
jgi:hypothetical protein